MHFVSRIPFIKRLGGMIMSMSWKTYSNNYIDKLKSDIEYYEKELDEVHRFRLELEKRHEHTDIYMKTLEHENDLMIMLNVMYDDLDELLYN